MKYDIVTIGSATQDVLMGAKDFHVASVQEFTVGQGLCVPLGSKIVLDEIVFTSGGGGTNAAVTFARQGYRTACVSIVGDDHRGRAILDELRREGVDGKYIQVRTGGSTAYSAILVGPNGERTILSYKGEGSRWEIKQVPWEQLDTGWMYVNSVGGDGELLEYISTLGERMGMHLATNPGTAELALGLPVLARFWQRFDIVGMNQEEAAELTGISYEREDDIFRKMDEVVGGIFIMTKGEAGVVVSDGHHVYTATVPNATVLERTGAGDAFHAGFTAEYIRSGAIEKAIQLGTANASSVVMHYGAKKGILARGDSGRWPLVQVHMRRL